MASLFRFSGKGALPGASMIRYPWATGRTGAWSALLFVLAALLISISPGFYVDRSAAEPGRPWLLPDVVSPYSFQINDEEQAEAQRQWIQENHPRVFLFDPTVAEQAGGKLDELFDAVAVAADKPETSPTLVAQLVGSSGLRLTTETLHLFVQRSKNARIRSDLGMVMAHAFGRGVTTEKSLFEHSLRQGRLRLEPTQTVDAGTTISSEGILLYPGEVFTYLETKYIPSFSLSPEMSAAFYEIARQLVRPNIVYSEEMTQAYKRESLSRMNPTRLVVQGSRIVKTGEIVSEVQAQMLRRLSGEERYYNFLRLLGGGVFVSFAALFLMLYAGKFHPELPFNPSTVMMIALPIIFSVALGRVVLNYGADPSAAAYAFPAGMVGMLGVILFEPLFAFMLVTIASMLFGIATGLNYQFMLVSLVGGYTGVVSLYAIRERKEVVLAGLKIALVNAVAILSVKLIMQPDRFSWTPAVGGILNGLTCYVLTLAALPFFEMIFGVTTDVRLMELTSTHHPLLREMEDKAPGSFQHSLNVAKLAESAAEDVGADYLLVRAGAYFHDIGKMMKPKYYTENQTTPEERRIHSKLSPYMSNLIIKNHVKDGIELAKEHHLPEKVLDFIPQHHGTSLIKFFYAQALQKAEQNDVVREDEFRYPGPKPQSREAAIVMLADTVEATVTAKLDASPVDEDDLRKLVRDSIFDKFHDGQFDECRMTFHDLHLIAESFVRTLMSRFHKRVDYPRIEKREPRESVRTERPAKVAGNV